MTVLRRLLVVQALLLWQGGFLFYAAVVVPHGTSLLGAAGQGAITARVTDTLNAIGAVGVGALALDLRFARDPDRRRRVCRWGVWLAILVCQLGLFYLHRVMDGYMDVDRLHVARAGFYPLHRAYLWMSTVQWALCLLLTWWTLRAWRAEDGPGSL